MSTVLMTFRKRFLTFPSLNGETLIAVRSINHVPSSVYYFSGEVVVVSVNQLTMYSFELSEVGLEIVK